MLGAARHSPDPNAYQASSQGRRSLTMIVRGRAPARRPAEMRPVAHVPNDFRLPFPFVAGLKNWLVSERAGVDEPS